MEPTEKKSQNNPGLLLLFKAWDQYLWTEPKKLGREKRGNKNEVLLDISYQSEATEEIFLTCVINFMIFEKQSKNHYSCFFFAYHSRGVYQLTST